MNRASQGLPGICSLLRAGFILGLEATCLGQFWTAWPKGATGSFILCLFLSNEQTFPRSFIRDFHTSLPRLGSHTLSYTCLWGVEWRYHDRPEGLIISENGCFWVHVTTKAPDGFLVRTKEANERGIQFNEVNMLYSYSHR